MGKARLWEKKKVGFYKPTKQWEQLYYIKKDRELNFHGRKDVNCNRCGMPTSCENEISIDLS